MPASRNPAASRVLVDGADAFSGANEAAPGASASSDARSARPGQGGFTAEHLIARKRETWPETSTLIADLVVRLFRLRDLVHESSRTRVKAAFDLTPAEFEVLVTLRTIAPPHALTPTHLRKAVLITPGGLTKVMRNLELRGLVTRADSRSDRRSRMIGLTPAGIRLAEAALPLVVEDYEAQLGSGLGQPEMERLSELLRRALQELENGGR